MQEFSKVVVGKRDANQIRPRFSFQHSLIVSTLLNSNEMPVHAAFSVLMECTERFVDGSADRRKSPFPKSAAENSMREIRRFSC